MNRILVGLLATIGVGVCLTLQAGSKYKCESTVNECLEYMGKKFANRGWVGIEYDVDEETGGLLVEHVIPDSPAFRADLRKGDHLMKVNGVAFATEDKKALERATKKWSPGDIVRYTINRRDQELQIKLKLGQMPKDVMAQWVGSHMVEHHMPAKHHDD